MIEDYEFHKAFARLCEVLGSSKQCDIAMQMGISQSSVSVTVRQEKIPATWLLAVLKTHNVNPEWVLHGDPAKKYLVPADAI